MKKTLTLLTLLFATSIATAISPIDYEALKKEHHETSNLCEATFQKLIAPTQGNANMLQTEAIEILKKAKLYVEEQNYENALDKINQFYHRWDLILKYDHFISCFDIYYRQECNKTYLTQLQGAADKFRETFLKPDAQFSFEENFKKRLQILADEYIGDLPAFWEMYKKPSTKLKTSELKDMQKTLEAFGEELKKITRCLAYDELKEVFFPEFMAELEMMLTETSYEGLEELKQLNIRYAKAELYREEVLQLRLKRNIMALTLLHHDISTRDADDIDLLLWHTKNLWQELQQRAQTFCSMSDELSADLLLLSRAALDDVNSFKEEKKIEKLIKIAQKFEKAMDLLEER